MTTLNYTYASNWKDQLASFDGKPISYDEIGNPVDYDGKSFTWEKGRQLTKIMGGIQNIKYEYDGQGRRTSKIVGSDTTAYTYVGSMLIRQSDGTDTLDFAYDAAGKAIGFLHDDTPYFYLRNLQGDVTGIMDASGAVVAKYSYDAWGNILDFWQESGYTVGELNPIRYRGYYYDSETGYYFLQTRYYSPEWRRFINADSLFIAGDDVLNGSNMYAYCNGNPVRYVDPNGTEPVDFWGMLVGLGSIFVQIVPGVVSFWSAVFGFIGGFDLSWIGDLVKNNGWINDLLSGAGNFIFPDFLPGVGAFANAVAGFFADIDFQALGEKIGNAAGFLWRDVIVPVGGAIVNFVKAIIDIITGSRVFQVDVDESFFLFDDDQGGNSQGVQGSGSGGGGPTYLSNGPSLFFPLKIGSATNVKHVYLAYMAETGDSESGCEDAYKSKLSVDLGSYAGASVKWDPVSNTNISLSPLTGKDTTVSANTGIATVTLDATVSDSTGVIGFASVIVVSVELDVSSEYVKSLTTIGPYPQLYSYWNPILVGPPSPNQSSTQVPKGGLAIRLATYKDYHLILSESTNNKLVGGFIHKDKMGTDNKGYIWYYLKAHLPDIVNDRTISDGHLAAIMGNIEKESQYSHLDAYPDTIYPGPSNPEYILVYDANDTIAWGIAQWRESSRKQGLLDYAGAKSRVGDINIQLGYLIYELTEVKYYKNFYITFLGKGGSSPTTETQIREATIYYCDKIEGDPGSASVERGTFAWNVYNVWRKTL